MKPRRIYYIIFSKKRSDKSELVPYNEAVIAAYLTTQYIIGIKFAEISVLIRGSSMIMPRRYDPGCCWLYIKPMGRAYESEMAEA